MVKGLLTAPAHALWGWGGGGGAGTGCPHAPPLWEAVLGRADSSAALSAPSLTHSHAVSAFSWAKGSHETSNTPNSCY